MACGRRRTERVPISGGVRMAMLEVGCRGWSCVMPRSALTLTVEVLAVQVITKGMREASPSQREWRGFHLSSLSLQSS